MDNKWLDALKVGDIVFIDDKIMNRTWMNRKSNDTIEEIAEEFKAAEMRGLRR